MPMTARMSGNASPTRFDRLFGPLFKQVDGASLVIFRMVFGATMLAQVILIFAKGRIAREFIEPGFFYHYYGFSWVHPWPGQGMS